MYNHSVFEDFDESENS